MPVRVAWRGCGLALVVGGCGPDAIDPDAYPRNCGVEGPVDLFEAAAPAYLGARLAGEHYLVAHQGETGALEYWAVDRCGEERVLLQSGPEQSSPYVSVAGPWILSCNEDTGAMAIFDPHGVEPSRALFDAVEGCRVVLVGGGLAAQQRGGSTVWFVADPADVRSAAVVVTDAALLSDPSWVHCHDTFACESWHPFGVDIRAAGDELLVVMQDASLLAFSPSTSTSRIVDGGPVMELDVLPDADLLVIGRDLGPTLIVERATGEAFEFCCYDDLHPIRELGDWLVKGHPSAPIIPEPDQWTNFRARRLSTGQTVEVVGRESWDPLARLSSDALLVEIDGERHAVWPATVTRQRVELPGEIWTLPGQDGVWATAENAVQLLDGPSSATRTLLDGVDVVFPDRDGRIVFEPARDSPEPTPVPLRVLMPDGRNLELDPSSLYAMPPWDAWPIDRDEIAWVADAGDTWIVRRTVLP